MTRATPFPAAMFVVLLGGEVVRGQEVTSEQLDWLFDHSIELEALEAGQGFDDLVELRDWIGDARIVALGESTHGSREIWQMKHRLVEYLATELGFTLLAIEALMPGAVAVNDYVTQGRGDARELCNTGEMLALVEWTRDYNAAGEGRLEYAGFDMRRPDEAAGVVLQFLQQHDPEGVAEVRQKYVRAVRSGRSPAPPFGIVTGRFPVEAAAGKHLRFSGFLRTQDVEQHARLWWQVDDDEAWTAFDNSAGQWPEGTTDWMNCAIEQDIPADAQEIHFGAVLLGEGTAWFDGLVIELDGEVVPLDSLGVDLDFESPGLQGLRCYSPNYRAIPDPEAARVGRQSLRLESQDRTSNGGFRSPREALALAREAQAHLLASQDRYRLTAANREIDWALQNARIVVQCLESRAGGVSRDQSMAANVRWLCERNPEARVIVWAHNVHVAREPGRMGDHLDQEYGEEYLAVAFGTGRGAYHARGPEGAVQQRLQRPSLDSFESFLATTEMPLFLLDLRDAREGSSASGWLIEVRPFRSVGVRALAEQFRPTQLAGWFDLVLYLDQTSPATPLR